MGVLKRRRTQRNSHGFAAGLCLGSMGQMHVLGHGRHIQESVVRRILLAAQEDAAGAIALDLCLRKLSRR
jgi:hypothetical protein